MPVSVRRSAKTVTVTAVFTALIAVSSLISFPLPSGVPVTLQTLAVALTGFCLGWKRGIPALVVYILLGIVGVPVFAGFSGGVAVLMGKTGGFIFGFIFLVSACALAAGLKSKALKIISGMAGLLLCHLTGVLWFSFLTRTGFFACAAAVSLPFIVKDALCVIGAALLSSKLQPVVQHYL